MTQLFAALWADEGGFVLSAELVLVGTIVVLGAVAGLVAIRDSIGGEMVEVANAFKRLDQSYSYGGMRGCRSWTGGSAFIENDIEGVHHDIICPPVVVNPSTPCTVTPAPCPVEPEPCLECPPEFVVPCEPEIMVPCPKVQAVPCPAGPVLPCPAEPIVPCPSAPCETPCESPCAQAPTAICPPLAPPAVICPPDPCSGNPVFLPPPSQPLVW